MDWQKRENQPFIENAMRPGDLRARAEVSFSGHERDHLFVNEAEGKSFTDIAGVSGLDSDSDGRAAVLFDYNRDGYLDVAFTSTNAPFLQVFRNNLGLERAAGRRDDGGRFVAFRFVGGNKTSAPSAEYSNRNGYGARVSVHLGGKVLLRETRCGEGLAAQNGETLLVGIGRHAKADRVEVKWPTGRTQEIRDVAAGALVTAFENAADSRDGSGFETKDYAPREGSSNGEATAGAVRSEPLRLELVTGAGGAAGDESGLPLRVVTTMATWCEACRSHLPGLEKLRAAFAEGEVEFYGMPVDPEDDAPKLGAYVEKYRPAYTLLADATPEQRAAVKSALIGSITHDPLPSTIITDRAGNVLFATEGLPSISDVRRTRALVVPRR